MYCLSGDMPCNQPCSVSTCLYNSCGHCQDNWVCEQRRDDDAKEVE